MYQLCEMVYFEIPFKDRRFRHAEPNPCTCTSTFPKSGVFAFDLLYLFFVFFWVLLKCIAQYAWSQACSSSAVQDDDSLVFWLKKIRRSEAAK